METSSSSDDGCPEVWQEKVGQEEEKSFRAPAKKESEGVATCKLEGEHSVLDKKKVKFSTITHRREGLLDYVHMCIWGPAKKASLGGHRYFVLLLIVYLSIVGYIL